MAYLIQASCTCGLESKHLLVGDGEHFLAICDQCQSVVNPQFIPFKFTLPPCPNCGYIIQPGGHIGSRQLTLSFGEPNPSEHRCPQCKTGILSFKEIMHLSVALDEVYPQPGQIVHGTFNGKDIEIPGVTVEYVCNLPNASSYEQNKFMELHVIDVDTKPQSNEAINITLEFIRYLSGKDLGYRE